MEKTLNEKLILIQGELKASKDKFNSYGRYAYRSCEGILEAAKPILHKYGVSLVISDDIVLVGNRYYIKATATLRCGEETISNTAWAREGEEKKGMDDAQLTGATSSYARKYALNGLFCIDDTKDADTDEYQNQQKAAQPQQKKQGAAQPQSQLPATVLNAIQAATTVDALAKIWSSNAAYQKMPQFVNAVSEKKKQLTAANGTSKK